VGRPDTSMKWKPIPTAVFVIAFVAVLLAGPIVVYSFMFGGSNAGIIAILAILFFFVALYIVVVRRYTD
jgi:high-affinity Fe2+/Pb2+ permease